MLRLALGFVTLGLVVMAVGEATGQTSEPEAWPRWRGPRGDGTWYGPRLPATWPEGGPKQIWRQPIAAGYAGVVVADGQVVTMDRPASRDVERILCFDASTGEPKWSHAYEAVYGDLQYGSGPRAAPTLHAGRVYALGAVGHLHALDAATGHVVWSKRLITNNEQLPTWGLAASPVVYQNMLIVHAGVAPDGCVLALDLVTGTEIWRSSPDGAGYATPILIDAPSGRQLVCWTPTNVRGIDPNTGQPLWTVPYKVTYGVSIAAPIFQQNLVFVSGYWEGAKAIRLGTEPRDAQLVWEDNRNLRGLMSQPLYRDGFAYLLDKRQGLTCFELATGHKRWDDDHRMTPRGDNPHASLVQLLNDDRVLMLNAEGELILATVNPDGYQEHSRARIIGPTWAHPAFAGTRVYARNDDELVAVSLVDEDQARVQSNLRD